jgi:F-type H+-transporting ATPase subunit c
MAIALMGFVLLTTSCVVLAQPTPDAPAPETQTQADEANPPAEVDVEVEAHQGEGESTGRGLAELGACLGAGVVVIGGGLSIGRIGGQAVDAIARQPEAAAQMFLAWLLPAAMIEGAMLFAVVLCLLVIIGG